MTKQLFILIGPKGSGKTTIGTIINQNTDITFLDVEPIWIDLHKRHNFNVIDGCNLVNNEIKKCFRTKKKVMIESLGVGEPFLRTMDTFQSIAEIKLIKVSTALETCLQRVLNRDNKNQIVVSDSQLKHYNSIVDQQKHHWDLTIDNNGPASKAEILKAIKSIS